MNNWVAIATILGGVIASAGGTEVIKAILKRRPRRVVEVASQIELAKQAQTYAAQLEEDARQAREAEARAWEESRRQSQAAWAQAEETQRKLVQVNRKLDETMDRLADVGRYVDGLVTRIHHPAATIEGVRDYIASTPPPRGSANGRAPH